MPKSAIDQIFFELYGYYPDKAGQAFELIVAAALKLLGNDEVEYDQRIRGEYSKTIYQLDGIVKRDTSKSMVEAKDYTIDNRKVGREDLQKLQGALTDLYIDKGIFASATDFTAPAKKYAESSSQNPLHKEIQLYHIRPSTEDDEKNILKSVCVTIVLFTPNMDGAKFDFVLTENTKDDLRSEGYTGDYFTHEVSEIYNEDGSVLTSISGLLQSFPPMSIDEEDFSAKATWVLKGGYFKMNNRLYSILGISYKIPYSSLNHDFIIASDGSFKLYVRSESGSTYKLITDEDLKKIRFLNGTVQNEKETFTL